MVKNRFNKQILFPILSCFMLLLLPLSPLRAQSFDQKLGEELMSNKTTLSMFSTAFYEERHKNYTAAIQKFEEIVSINPNSLVGWYAYTGLLACYQGLGGKEKFNQFIRKHILYTKQLLQIEEYISITPGIKSILAEDYAALDEPTKNEIAEGKVFAVQAFKGLKPDSPDGYKIWKSKRALGLLYEREKNLEKAKQTYEELIPTVTDKVWKERVQLDYAKVLNKMGRKEEAKKILNELNIKIKKDSKIGKDIQEFLEQRQ